MIQASLTPEAQVIEAMFNIISKEKEMVPFKLKPGQAEYDLHRTTRDMIPKARQEGFSSLGIAYQVVDCLTQYGSRCVLMSHEGKATQRLLGRANYYLRTINGPQADLGRVSQNEIFFPKTESTYYIGTAGSKAFGRGDTITHLHISEYAWWESDALDKVAGLFQAVPKNGTIRIESTGRGRNNDFYFMCMNAEELGYKVHFHPWWKTPEYFIHTDRKWVPHGFENYFQDMKLKYHLTQDQLYWYWTKLMEFRLDIKTMQQEYPSYLEECFQATGGQVFQNVSRVKSDYWKWGRDEDLNLRYEYLEGHPKPGYDYIFGGDPSGGTGNDDAALVGICVQTLEQVYEFANNRLDPVGFSYLMIRQGQKYNQAYLVPEANKHGAAVVPILVQEYPTMKIYKRQLPKSPQGEIKYGFMTTEITKNGLVGIMIEALDLGLTIYGERLEQQLKAFEEDPDNPGKYFGLPHDDLTIAVCLACQGLLKKYKNFLIYHVKPKPEPPKPSYEGVNLRFYTYDELFKDRDKIRSRHELGGPLLPSLESMIRRN